MLILTRGECAKISRETGADIWEWFQATPENPNFVAKAISLCNCCGIRWQCLESNYEHDAVIAGGYSPYERKLLRWKRVDNVGDNNWRSIDCVIRELRGPEE